MRLKELCFFDGFFGLLNVTSRVAKELQGSSFSLGRWYDGTKEAGEQTMKNFDGMNEEARANLDTFIKVKLGNSEVNKYFDLTGLTDEQKKLVYNDIACLFKTREEQLNNQFYSILLEYNPIDNYDRTETQTHNESNTIGARQTTLNSGARSESNSYGARSESNSYGARSESNTKGARTDSTIDNNSASPFDSTAYNKPTTKSESTFTSGAETDGHTAQAYTDGHTAQAYTDGHTSQAVTDTQSTQQATDSNSGGYTLRARGNIGTMTTGYMLNEYRANALFNFADEILKIIENDITKMNYDI